MFSYSPPLKVKIIYFLIVGIALVGFTVLNPELFFIPKNFPKPVYNFAKNPFSKSKVELGRALFYDPILSKDNTISCTSCHSQFSAFTHIDHALSHGINDKIGKRNSPALMNLAWQTNFMHDGAINHLDMQSLAPITSNTEMDETFENVVTKLQKTSLYPKLFFNAFGDSVITGEYVLKSIAQFMLTLVSSNSKYDSVLQKKALFTLQEKKGYALFKQKCATCHTEPLFTNNKFENNGLKLDSFLQDYGRFRVTNNQADKLKFKVPTLRNIEFSYPYMHDGRFKTLMQVLNHYTNGIAKSATLSSKLQKPIQLTVNQKVDLIAFLLTLTDKSFIFNPNFSYPKKVFLTK